VNVALAPLVIAGAWSTVSVNACEAFGVTPFVAVIVIEYAFAVPAAGVPLKTPAELKVTPEGNAPVSLNVGAGKPPAVTVNVPADPTVNVVLFALVIVGAKPTVSVKLCVAFVPIPFCAVKLML
jgi:hypothetical protein